ncbi:MAG: glutaminase A [Akkermansia sp.]
MNNQEIEAALRKAYLQHRDCQQGENASYIPALAQVDSRLFGLAAVTVQGEIICVGDFMAPFAIESISKAFNLSLAMDTHGAAALRQKVGAEATGQGFNSVLALELHSGKPLSPLVNAGAIATVSLVNGQGAPEVWENMSQRFNQLCGNELSVMEEVYESESQNNDHNRAITYLLRSSGYLYNEPELSLDLYTRMCSIGVTVRDLAVMGACYANGGINPLSGMQVVKRENVPDILADMCMEGLYTGSGSWLYENGLPAKSGVGGGIVCVVPSKMALAAFSPPLNADGNSVRAIAALTDIIRELDLNPLRS